MEGGESSSDVDVKEEPMLEEEFSSFLDVELNEQDAQFVICEVDSEQKDDTNSEIQCEPSLQHHNESSSKSQGFPCDMCGKFLSTRMTLYNHKKFVHMRDTLLHFVCKLCGSALPTMTRFRDHYNNVHSTDIFRCVLCRYEGKSKRYVDKHFARVHYTSKRFACDVCEKRFPNLQAITRHKIIHLPSRPVITCELCGKKFLSTCALKQHNVKQHSNKNEEIPCPMCNRIFNHKLGLSQHLSRVHIGKILNCEHCSYHSRSKYSLKCHILIHLREPGYKFIRKKSNNIKKKIITNLETNKTSLQLEVFETFKCDICDVVLKTRNILAKHKRNVHSSTRHKCNQCRKHFGSKDTLRCHVARVHDNSCKIYQCNFCEKSCKSNGDLKKHLVVHSDDRPFKCKICPSAFKYKNALKKHNDWHFKQGLNTEIKTEPVELTE